MGVTVNVNGLSLVHQGSGGVSMATVPDVCKTPPNGAPVPYPNITYSKDLIKGTRNVTADGGNSIAIKGSETPVSTGDESGSMGGVKSGVFKHRSTWLSYSPDVKFEGQQACRRTDKKLHNKGNALNASGKRQPPVPSAEIVEALCEIFCKVRQEGIDFKKKNPHARFDYSKRARDLASKHPKLKGLMFERSMLVAVDNAKRRVVQAAKDAGRKVWGLDAIKKRLAKELAERVGKKAAVKLAKKAVVKFIPVVNVLSLAWDVYDLATLGAEAYKLASEFMETYDPVKYTTFEIRPDVARPGPAGDVSEIWDFKFDRPALTADDGTRVPAYKDKFNPDQYELFTEKTGGRTPKEIDLDRCKHKCK